MKKSNTKHLPIKRNSALNPKTNFHDSYVEICIKVVCNFNSNSEIKPP